MTAIQDALEQLKIVVKTIDVSNPPGSRVWNHPVDSELIETENFPFVVISKMNTEVGSWKIGSYGVGQHIWQAVIAVYLGPGPIIVTNNNKDTAKLMEEANEWYEKLADLLFQNLSLNGTVKFLGDLEGNQLFDYITDNIIWDGQEYYGHLFLVQVYQDVIQTTSS